MFWRYSKSLKGFIQVWTKYDVEHLLNDEEYDKVFNWHQRSCSFGLRHIIPECSYSPIKRRICGNREIIRNEILDDSVYDYKGCSSYDSSLFGVNLIGKSLYIKCYANNKME